MHLAVVASVVCVVALVVGAPGVATAGERRCTIVGTARGEIISGTARDDVVCGEGGNDVIIGFGGDDVLLGGGGDDRLLGKDGDDTLIGGPGADLLDGGTGSNPCVGGSATSFGRHDRLVIDRCEDVTAPRLVGVTITPKGMAAYSAGAVVTVALRIADDLSGLGFGSGCEFGFQSPQREQFGGFGSCVNVIGTFQAPPWRCLTSQGTSVASTELASDQSLAAAGSSCPPATDPVDEAVYGSFRNDEAWRRAIASESVGEGTRLYQGCRADDTCSSIITIHRLAQDRILEATWQIDVEFERFSKLGMWRFTLGDDEAWGTPHIWDNAQNKRVHWPIGVKRIVTRPLAGATVSPLPAGFAQTIVNRQ